MAAHEKRTAPQIEPYVGSMAQLARIRTSVLDDGRARGMRIADVDNGSGLRFCVLVGRGLDIGDASVGGVPFAYHTPVGWVAPQHYEATGLRWLRSFGGGLPHCSAVGLARPMSVHQPFWRRLAADNGFCRMLRTLRQEIEQR